MAEQTIYSHNLGNQWREEVVVADENKELYLKLIFADKKPHIANLVIRLIGRKSRAEVLVAYLGRRDDETLMDIKLIHDAPETYGRIITKAALFDNSYFKFNGLLDITARGKGSDSYLLARGLMLSPQARAEIYPYLEIKTDEVKASHGSSIGRFDQNQIFYLQSRGLTQGESQKILLREFFREVSNNLPLIYRQKFFQNK